MTRLTIASLTAELAAKNISLTGKTGSYSIVFPNGERKVKTNLAEVKLSVELWEQDTNNLSKVQTEPTPAESMNTQSTRVNQLFSYAQEHGADVDWLGHETSMEEDEQEIGAQLVREADERRALKQNSIDTIDHIAASEEYIDYLFAPVPEDKQPKAKLHKGFKPLQMHNTRYATGFGNGMTNTPRVNKQLQKRSNKFFASIA